MRGSGGNNAGGGGQRPFGRYAELNEAHARIAKERTDRSVPLFVKADPTHPAASPGSAPAVVTGNRWAEWGRAMVDQLHGRMFGRYAPAPGGTEIHSAAPSVARGHQTGEQAAGPAHPTHGVKATPGQIAIETATLQEHARHRTVAARLPEKVEAPMRAPDRQPNAGPSAPVRPTNAAVVPERAPQSGKATPGQITIETATLQEHARHRTVAARLPEPAEAPPRAPDRQPDAGSPAAVSHTSGPVNFIYDRMSRATALKEAAGRDAAVNPTNTAVNFIYDHLTRAAALKEAAERDRATQTATAFRRAEWEVGNRHTLSPDRDTVAARPVSQAVKPPAKASTMDLATPGTSGGGATGIEPGD